MDENKPLHPDLDNSQVVLSFHLCTVIECWEDGLLDRIVYIHRSEYRHWDA